MKLTFSYSMRLEFDGGAARGHAFSLRCLPQETACQHVENEYIEVTPHANLSFGTDGFGNRYCYGTVNESHEAFSVSASGAISMNPGIRETASPGFAMLYRHFTEKTAPGECLIKLHDSIDRLNCSSGGFHGSHGQFHDSCYTSHVSIGRFYDGPVRFNGVSDKLHDNSDGHSDMTDRSADTFSGSVYERSLAIRDMVHSFMIYAPGETDPATSAEEAVRRGAGVCQDFAHIMLSLCRMDHIACRYTAGLLMGEGQSHAWVEIFDGGQWIPLDPTNPDSGDDERLVFSHGRDADDCEINRGIYIGPRSRLSFIRAELETV